MDGNNYSVPLYRHAHVMWIRKDLLEKNGLEVPKTWDELYDTAKPYKGRCLLDCPSHAGQMTSRQPFSWISM